MHTYIHIDLRRVHTMKIIHIGSELICIVSVHTECALTQFALNALSVNPLP